MLSLLLAPLVSHALSSQFWNSLKSRPTSIALFHEIARVPRASKHEDKIRKFVADLVDEARHRVWRGARVEVLRDSVGNQLIRLPGRGRYMRGRKPIALQVHSDMVEKAVDAAALEQMRRAGIDVVETDGWLHSRGHKTTLGADNGIGMAQALRFLVNPLVDQPPLEILITIEEECGMRGAREMGFKLDAACLINIDWDRDGVLGHEDSASQNTWLTAQIPTEGAPARTELVRLDAKLSNLPGGHSGIDIAKGRPNAVIFAADILERGLGDAWLHDLNSGDAEKLNVIATEAHFGVLTPRRDVAATIERLKQAFATSVHRTEEARFEIAPPQPFVGDAASSPGATKRALERVASAINGVLKPRDEYPYWQASSNLGFVRFETGRLDLGVMVRSYDAPLGARAVRAIQSHFHTIESMRAVEPAAAFPERWRADRTSFLFRTAERVDPTWQPAVAPGSTELMRLSPRIGPIPTLSIGVNMVDIHSEAERTEIASAARTEKFLAKLVVELASCEELILR